MKRSIKNYKNFLKENTAEPMVKPKTKPETAPQKTPSRPNPFRKDKPSVSPKPKATAEELADKFLNMTKGDNDIQELLKNKYDL